MRIDNEPHELFSPTDAKIKASELQTGDPDWTYSVVDDLAGTGYSFIEIYDEDMQFVGRV